MNLIEQLGGYEETKKHLDSCWCDDDNREYLLEKLLEYRRQHNIFEKGDKVIYLILSNNVIIYDDWLKTQNSNWIRHATQEEIEVGHRL